jgi:two-component system chemotaxis response regulator CheY
MFDKKTKILIVDDMNMFRQMVRHSLTALEFKKLSEATDGDRAFTELSQAIEFNDPYQLVISDWNMPKMKGIDLLRKIRATDWGKTLPFIMLTAEAEVANVREAVGAGVDSYIIKPFTIDQMRSKLEQTHQKITKPKAS